MIAEKFIDLFKQNKFENITLEQINENNSLKTKDYFTNKYEILNYILKDKLTEKIELINSLRDKKVSLQSKLIIFFDYHFDFLKDYPNISDILIKTSMSEDENKIEIISSYMKKFKETFSKLIVEEIKNNKIRNVNPEIIANAILHATHGVTVKIKYDDDYNYATAKKELINFIYLGLNN